MLGDKSVFAVLGITGVSGVLLHRSLLLSLSSNTETLEKKIIYLRVSLHIILLADAPTVFLYYSDYYTTLVPRRYGM